MTAFDILALKKDRIELLAALKRMDALVDSLWESIPWKDTFNLNIQELNEAPIQAKRVIAKVEERMRP